PASEGRDRVRACARRIEEVGAVAGIERERGGAAHTVRSARQAACGQEQGAAKAPWRLRDGRFYTRAEQVCPVELIKRIATLAQHIDRIATLDEVGDAAHAGIRRRL